MMEGQRRTLVSRPKIETMALELEGNWGWLVWEWESGKMIFFVQDREHKRVSQETLWFYIFKLLKRPSKLYGAIKPTARPQIA